MVRILLKIMLMYGVFLPLCGGQKSYNKKVSPEAQQLFSTIETKKFSKIPLTQSEAHLTSKKVQDKVAMVDLNQFKEIREAVFDNEKKFNKDYDIVYTAVPSFMRLFQDLTNELYKRTTGISTPDFIFLRYTYHDSVYDHYKNVTDFLIQEIEKEGMIDDNLLHIKTILISTNLAFFGNEGLAGESTRNYMVNTQSWISVSAPWITSLMRSCLASFNYPKSFAQELLQLAQEIQKTTGDLLQICMPHALTDQIAYVSWRQGIPFDTFFIEKVFGQKISNAIVHEIINQKITEIKTKYKANDPEMRQLVNQLIATIKKGNYRLSPFLQRYKTNPESLPLINAYQARLLVTNKDLLNPQSGIKMFRYSLLSPSEEHEYINKLNDIVSRMDIVKNATKTTKIQKTDPLLVFAQDLAAIG